ncbi:MAG: hypothetical protein H9535_17405 [Ignavibacteria bacterium]|nr:hypothetical protein [Ignavibacteria bacterium]
MEHLPEVFMVITVFLGVPSIITGAILGMRFLRIVERREERAAQELAISEKRMMLEERDREQEMAIFEKKLALEERERELEIYKLELEIRRLESDFGSDNKQLPN